MTVRPDARVRRRCRKAASRSASRWAVGSSSRRSRASPAIAVPGRAVAVRRPTGPVRPGRSGSRAAAIRQEIAAGGVEGILQHGVVRCRCGKGQVFPHRGFQRPGLLADPADRRGERVARRQGLAIDPDTAGRRIRKPEQGKQGGRLAAARRTPQHGDGAGRRHGRQTRQDGLARPCEIDRLPFDARCLGEGGEADRLRPGFAIGEQGGEGFGARRGIAAGMVKARELPDRGEELRGEDEGSQAFAQGEGLEGLEGKDAEELEADIDGHQGNRHRGKELQHRRGQEGDAQDRHRAAGELTGGGLDHPGPRVSRR